MNVQSNPLLPASTDPAVQSLLRSFAQQINSLTNGKASAITNASTAAPAAGTGNPGDFVAKQGAVAAGPVGAQYVVTGWRCVATGSTPSTQWVEVLENVRIPPSSTPAPTPAPTSAPAPAVAYSQKIQAENATLHGITAVTTIAGYEGTGHADWFRSGYDEYLEFSFTGVPTGGASGNLTLRVANYGDQTITVLLNGATTGTMYTITNTGAAWTLFVISGVTLNGGTTTVRLTPEYSGYTYVDYAQFDQTTGAPPPPPPAPAPTPAPPAAPAPSTSGTGASPAYPFGARTDLAQATLATPGVATGTGSTTGGSLAAGTYYVRIVAVDAGGKNTAAGPESTGIAVTGTTSSIAYTWAAITGASSYQIFYGTSAGGELAYYTSTTASFTLTATSGAAGTPAGMYPYGIQPSGYTQAQMDSAIKACYDKWKLNRLAKSPTFVASGGVYAGQTITDGYHVQWSDANFACVSEGIGYGMLITVLMAGYDANAQTYFNGLLRVYRACPAYAMRSTNGANVYLMDYKLLPNMSSAGDGYSASDGDMDAALALLMAHRQWGSSGTFNYYQEALNIINALKGNGFNYAPGTSANGVMYAVNISRVSDYRPAHFRAFKKATNDSFWDDARTNSLALVQKVTNAFSPSAHLQPGFIYDPFGTNPRPDTVVHLDRSGIEQIYDGNSVRNPWIWGTDYVYSGDTGWGTLAQNIATQMQSSSGGSVNGFTWAYNLDGTPYQGGLYHDGGTAGCVMAGCMTNSSFQTFLNNLYASNIGSGYDTRYYYAELMLLPLILATGNWWRP